MAFVFTIPSAHALTTDPFFSCRLTSTRSTQTAAEPDRQWQSEVFTQTQYYACNKQTQSTEVVGGNKMLTCSISDKNELFVYQDDQPYLEETVTVYFEGYEVQLNLS